MKKRIFTSLVIIFILILGILNKARLLDLNSRDDLINHEVGQTAEERNNQEEKPIDETIIEEPVISNINLLAVGDIMFHMPQIKSAYIGEGSYDFNPMFNYVKKYIEAADIALGNYETVSLPNRDYSGYPRFNSPKETLSALKEAGFDVISTANNHSLDQGREGIISTIDIIEELGMKSIGTSKEANTPILIQELEGIKLGLLSYTYGMNGLDSLLNQEELSYMINQIDEEKIEADIEQLKNEAVDLIVIFIHWGHEYHSEPSEEQIKLANKMVKWGGNIILGSHPHVIQKSEIIEYGGKDNFVIYSMGNFLSNQRLETMGNSFTEDGLMVSLDLEKDFTKNKTIIKNITFIPTWVHKYTKDSKVFYDILPIEEIINDQEELNLSGKTIDRLKKSLEDTMRTLVNK